MVESIQAVLANEESAEDVSAFLAELLSSKELQQLENRWKALELLSNGIPQRSVSRQLGISISTVSRAANILKSEESFVKKILNDKYGNDE